MCKTCSGTAVVGACANDDQPIHSLEKANYDITVLISLAIKIHSISCL